MSTEFASHIDPQRAHFLMSLDAPRELVERFYDKDNLKTSFEITTIARGVMEYLNTLREAAHAVGIVKPSTARSGMLDRINPSDIKDHSYKQFVFWGQGATLIHEELELDEGGINRVHIQQGDFSITLLGRYSYDEEGKDEEVIQIRSAGQEVAQLTQEEEREPQLNIREGYNDGQIRQLIWDKTKRLRDTTPLPTTLPQGAIVTL